MNFLEIGTLTCVLFCILSYAYTPGTKWILFTNRKEQSTPFLHSFLVGNQEIILFVIYFNKRYESVSNS